MPKQTSAELLDRFSKSIDLGLRDTYRELLAKLGDPQHHLPPVFHVAGTNGKGSTCAFLRAILEAAGYRVHVYTSPHLVEFHERIRVAGALISEEQFTNILAECEQLSASGSVTQFEALTAAALAVFARTPADFTILEVGLGGRLDATNVVDRPLATIITRLSYDHRQHLGESLTEIAREKAGIMRKDVPCFVASQPSEEALTSLRAAAAETGASLVIGGKDWRVTPTSNGFHYQDAQRTFDLPLPALPGIHQLGNAGLAIAALSVLPQPLPIEAIIRGLQTVAWPARLQKLTEGRLRTCLPDGWELWLDGGHNDSAGEVLAQQAKLWREVESDPKDLHLICGMLNTKKPQEFLTPLVPYAASFHAVAIPGEPLSLTAEMLAADAQDAGVAQVGHSTTLENALRETVRISSKKQGRVLICGSLYLAGEVLKQNAG